MVKASGQVQVQVQGSVSQLRGEVCRSLSLVAALDEAQLKALRADLTMGVGTMRAAEEIYSLLSKDLVALVAHTEAVRAGTSSAASSWRCKARWTPATPSLRATWPVQRTTARPPPAMKSVTSASPARDSTPAQIAQRVVSRAKAPPGKASSALRSCVQSLALACDPPAG